MTHSETSVTTLDFKTLFESAPGLYLVLTPDGKIVAVSDAYLHATMTKREEILGRELFDVLPENFDEQTVTKVNNLRASLNSVRQNRVPHKMGIHKYDISRSEFTTDGAEQRYWSQVNSPVFGANNEITHIIHSIEDVTEFVLEMARERQESARHVEAEQALKRITDKVRDSLDESQILQTALQELALVLDVNCCNTALYNLEEGISTIYYEYATVNPGAQARVMQIANFPEVYQQILNGQYCQFCSIFPNPIRGRVTLLACPILDDQGVLGDLWLITQHDYAFTDLEIRLVQQVANQCAIALRQARLYQAAKAQVEELQKLSRLKDDFLSTVSHELRTPMSNIKMAIQMLKISTTSERSQIYLDILQNECGREIQLINDLLDLQRLETASYPNLVVEAINLQDWLPTIVESFVIRTQQRQQTLQINLPPHLPTLISDRANLERIITELLNNACKYTPADGEIILSVCGKSDLVTTVFTISNSVEIAAVELPRIFDKFYRVCDDDRWKQGGTGLGLALVEKLVEQLEGKIVVESSKGWTTFTIELPTSLHSSPEPVRG
ncbi:ATP-binding protein [Iningainema tapete]|uniref:histidine kinase n=1 Tax=Iningainema tapete BLCC-T55 TaxID=2748662 RepID=A0A8J6XPC6_9CYAN|nr:ATP-binding protein [Iningainema tapete]MBD2776982.1 PAS domain-containing protein [Iningainema tapete BLCC-T55]